MTTYYLKLWTKPWTRFTASYAGLPMATASCGTATSLASMFAALSVS